MDSEPGPRRSKREHQPSAKAAASAAPPTLPPTSSCVSRRSQRRRVTRSASPASTPASRNSSPMRGGAPLSASFNRVSVVVDGVGPNGQRRRLRAAAHTGSNSSVTQGIPSSDPRGVLDDGKVLGRYSSHDCALLCEVILGQLKKQTMAPTVLDEAKSPALIRWKPVAKKMEMIHKLRMTPRECQHLWKFLAYGEIPVVETVKEDELLPDSDEEELHKTPKEINAQLTARRANAVAKEVQLVATGGTTEEQDERVATSEVAAKSSEEAEQVEAGETQGPKQEKTQGDDTPEMMEKENESSVRLYPTYSLPTGAPDAWYRPFSQKDALPLTFVASRFLKRKANPPVRALVVKSAATPGSSSAGPGSLTNVKRKQAVMTSVATAAKKPKLASTPPRVLTPSSTPPPAAKRARSELEFFELRLREEEARKTPGASLELSTADIQRRFGEASAEVRRQCQALAAHDVERFNREVVRLRIWQKATGTRNNEPKLTPAPAPALKPTASPLQTSSATMQRTDPTAALLAHAAAVAATASKPKSPASTSTTAIAPKAVQEQKDGTATAKSDAK